LEAGDVVVLPTESRFVAEDVQHALSASSGLGRVAPGSPTILLLVRI
jgi:hypothetical protein